MPRWPAVLLAVVALAVLPGAQASYQDPLAPHERAYIEDHGPFYVALAPTGPPFGFIDADGVARGITVDLLRLIAVDLGIDFRYMAPDGFSEGRNALLNGTADISAPTLQSHDPSVSFTKPYAWARFGFWVGPSMPLAMSAEDLAGARVAVPDSSTVRAFLLDYPYIEPVTVPDMLSAARLVEQGEADAAFGGYSNIGYYLETGQVTGLRPLGVTHMQEAVLAVARDDPVLLSILDKGLQRLDPQERLAVYTKWTGTDLGAPEAAARAPPSALWWVVGAASASLVVLLASSSVLRRQVRTRTADLQAEHAKLERIMETSPGGLAMVHPDGTIEYANRRAEEMLGLRRVGHAPGFYEEPAWQIRAVDGQEFPADELPVPTVLRTCEPVHGVRYAIEWTDGRRTPLSVNAAPLFDSQGRVAAVVTAFEDLSAQLAIQEAERTEFLRRIEMQRLQEIDRFRTEFMNAAAHEIKNPLTPLSVQLHLLERDPAGLSETQQRAVMVLRRNLERLSRLVSDMLDVTRLDAGRMPLEMQRCDLEGLVLETARSFEAVAHTQGIEFEVDTVPVEVEADPQRITQVLYNLVGNAIKYTHTQGQVTLRLRQHEDRAVLQVEDTGVGLTHEQMAALFEPFSRIHDIDVPGTGLGLHISKGIVEAHGGTVTCSSDGPARGSTFTLQLPAVKATPLEGPVLGIAQAI